MCFHDIHEQETECSTSQMTGSVTIQIKQLRFYQRFHVLNIHQEIQEVILHSKKDFNGYYRSKIAPL